MTVPIATGAGFLPAAGERSCDAATPGNTEVRQFPKILAIAHNEPGLER